MRILLACDINTNGKGNPFMPQLLHALAAHPKVTAVQHGTSWMRVPEVSFDVVHIHWPEALTDWAEPTKKELSEVKSSLLRWSKESAIVATVHNKYPHYNDSPAFRTLYQMVYEYADGIIHLGEASKEVMRNRYEKEMVKSKEVVIPHGNYDWFPNSVSQKKARVKLGVGDDDEVFLCIGSIRDMEELNLLLQGFSSAVIEDKHLIIATSLPHRKRTELRYWTTRLPLHFDSNIRLHEKYISVEDMQYFVKAADALVIPRLRSLNSGDVALGLTFGRIVIGPNIGVIGEMLKQTSNPVFDPSYPATLGEAMVQAVKSKNGNLPKQNEEYAATELSWQRVASSHFLAYEAATRIKEGGEKNRQAYISAKSHCTDR